jgi:hypothetical protein
MSLESYFESLLLKTSGVQEFALVTDNAAMPRIHQPEDENSTGKKQTGKMRRTPSFFGSLPSDDSSCQPPSGPSRKASCDDLMKLTLTTTLSAKDPQHSPALRRERWDDLSARPLDGSSPSIMIQQEESERSPPRVPTRLESHDDLYALTSAITSSPLIQRRESCGDLVCVSPLFLF